jgi:hypothetical protein
MFVNDILLSISINTLMRMLFSSLSSRYNNENYLSKFVYPIDINYSSSINYGR